MVLPQSLLTTFYLLSVILSIGVLGIIWQYRDRRGLLPLFVTACGALIWSLAPLVASLSSSYALTEFMTRFLYVGVVIAVFGYFVFALEYSGHERWIQPWLLGLLSIMPILTVVFAFVNPRNLFYSTIEPAQTEWGVAFEFGPAFWIHATYSFLLMSVASILIFGFLIRSQRIYRWQATAVLLGIVFPFVTSVAHLIGPFEFTTTPIGISAACLLYVFAVTRYRLMDIAPIGRERVFESINDIVLVMDPSHRVIDVNPRARELASSNDHDIPGEQIESLYSNLPQFQSAYQTITDTGSEQSFEFSHDGKDFDCEISPIYDNRDRHVGWLVVGHDVTEQKRRERELEQRNEQLDQFARIVSHDLRNPLNVANTRLELATDECESEHLDHIGEAHDRMETIVEETLTLARMGQKVTDTERIELGRSVHEWWGVVETGTATLEAPESLVIEADTNRLGQVFENLFRNAVQHGGKNVTVRVGILDGNGFFVEDNGPGIPDDVDIFKVGSTSRAEGTGFGLSIVKEILTAHGWEIDVTESAEGGARFEITGVTVLETGS